MLLYTYHKLKLINKIILLRCDSKSARGFIKMPKKTFHAARGTAIWVGCRRSARELILSYDCHYIYLFIIYLINRHLKISFAQRRGSVQSTGESVWPYRLFSKPLTWPHLKNVTSVQNDNVALYWSHVRKTTSCEHRVLGEVGRWINGKCTFLWGGCGWGEGAGL